MYLAIGVVTIAATYYFATKSGNSKNTVQISSSSSVRDGKSVAVSGSAESRPLRGDTTFSQSAGSRPPVSEIDSDYAGMRSDVDKIIKEKYADNEKRRAFLQYARAEKIFMAKGANQAGAREGAQGIDKAMACLRAIAPEQYRVQSKQVLALLLNTPEHFRAYALATKNLGGQVVPGYSGGSPCE